MNRFIELTILKVAVYCKLHTQHPGDNPFARFGYKADVYIFGKTKSFTIKRRS